MLGPTFEKVAPKWGFKFEITRRRNSAKATAFLAEAQPAASGLEAALPWHSELHFAEVQPPWKTLYSVDGQPVLIERPWGAGSLVLASDGYFLSNEGLRASTRAAKLIAHLVGGQRTIVFDEEHLGLSEQSGVATLARKYRLHGFIAGLALVALLFIWQNLVRFVPPQEEALAAATPVAGRGNREGFLALLRRSVPTGQLLAQCVAAWRRTYTGDVRALERLESVYDENAQPRKAPEIVAQYQALARAVHRPLERPTPSP